MTLVVAHRAGLAGPWALVICPLVRDLRTIVTIDQVEEVRGRLQLTRMRRKVKVLAGLALVWVSGALYILHSNSHEVRCQLF